MAKIKMAENLEHCHQLAIALGERTGLFIAAEDVRQVGDWVFHRLDPHGPEVACSRLPLPVCAEPWDGIPIAESPFSPHHPNLPATIAKLTREYEAGMAEEDEDSEND